MHWYYYHCISLRRKLRLKDIKALAQGYTASKGQSWDSLGTELKMLRRLYLCFRGGEHQETPPLGGRAWGQHGMPSAPGEQAHCTTHHLVSCCSAQWTHHLSSLIKQFQPCPSWVSEYCKVDDVWQPRIMFFCQPWRSQGFILRKDGITVLDHHTAFLGFLNWIIWLYPPCLKP